jgi:hypothetical protein
VPQSGAIERCPDCHRALVNDHCVVHLDVDAVKDLRVKAKLSDDRILIFNGETVEDVLEVTTEDMHALPEHDVLSIINGNFKGKTVDATISPIDDNLFRVDELVELR